jgi:hypothetical protein
VGLPYLFRDLVAYIGAQVNSEMIYLVVQKIETDRSSDRKHQPRLIIVGKDRIDALSKILGPVKPIAELKGAFRISSLPSGGVNH